MLFLKVDPVIEILELDDVKELMESTRDRDGNNKILDFLQQNHNFQLDMVDALFKYAKFMYECGNYTAASVCLYYYRNLVPQADPNYLNALYGKLASEILLQEWDHARDDLVKLRAYIDSNPFDTEWELIHQRAWLMHWALFVYFNYPKGRDDIIEMFLNQQLYLNTIQVMCPHLLRYLAVAVVTSKNKQKNSLKDLIKVIDIERHNYQDPVTDFLTCLYIKYDFDEAQEKLRQCEEEWDHARDDLVKLRAYIDSNPFDTEWELIHQRAWLMHWALFVYFNYPKGRDDIIEMFLNQQLYLNTIQVMCPHLLRYLAVAVVTSKNKQKNSLKDLIKVIDIERHNYQDPVTDFLTCLYIKYDFDEAQEKLRQCEEVLSNDFFLTGCLSDFRESARLLIFEMFCRIHQCISIEMLARRLNMSQVLLLFKFSPLILYIHKCKTG
ncbi:unnamed protein product [Strongylus vulgaris]|uniref:PCI domain-containing protein n=1 Tax=Strongylus vulgaris TaxID=40348 RepID=A0A3P7JHK7_STRVU|nr:unnamed protein product [Strongylus vulgaris]